LENIWGGLADGCSYSGRNPASTGVFLIKEADETAMILIFPASGKLRRLKESEEATIGSYGEGRSR